MYSVFAVAIIYQFFVNGKKFGVKTLAGYFLMMYLIVLTLHLASRVSLISLFVVLGFLLGSSIQQFKLRSLWVILPLLACCAYLMNLEIFAMTDRYRHAIHSPFEKPTRGTHDDRAVAWYSSLQIIKDNFWLGVGTGDARGELNKKYLELGEEAIAAVNLNSHNQFLDSSIRNGILGLASLIVMYLFGLWNSRFHCLPYSMFVVVIIVTSLTENILDRQQGDVFWCVFNVLLYRYSKEPVN
jgi:O-antigen ligase